MRTRPLTEGEALETLEATRDQIAIGDSVVVVHGGRFRTDRAVIRSLAIGDKLTVVGIGDDTAEVQDHDGNRFKIQCGYLKPNPKGKR